MTGLAQHLDQTVHQLVLKWLKFSLGLLALFLVLDPWTIPHDLPLAIFIRLSSIVVLGFAFSRLRKHPLAAGRSDLAASGLILFLLSLCVTYYTLLHDPYFEVYVRLLLIANGMLSLQTLPVLATSAIIMLAWAGAHDFVYSPLDGNQLLLTGVAALIGFHSFLSRRKIMLDQWELREKERALHGGLLEALKAAQEARAWLKAEETQASGAVSQAIGEIIVNRQQRSKLHRHLLHANRLSALGRLAAGLAHRLNNRLMVLLGTVDSLELEHLDEEAQEILDESRQAIERGAKLVEQLLPLTGHHHISPEAVSCGELFEQFLPLLKKTQAPLKLINRAPYSKISVDPEAWFQVLTNLIRNADEMNPSGQAIELLVEEDDGVLVFSVKDRGPGVPRRYREKIFEPFFTTKAERGGTGLGLSIVLGLVEQMGGQLTVSPRRGGGSKFSVAFSTVSECGESKGNPQESQEGHSLQGRRVLVVEDDPKVLRALQLHLQRMGLDVSTASNGEEGLKRYCHQPVPIVITDVVMPNMDGPSLARELWKRDPKLKVLFTSGYSDDRLRDAELDIGECEFLAKPYSREVLAETLQRVMGCPA